MAGCNVVLHDTTLMMMMRILHSGPTIDRGCPTPDRPSADPSKYTAGSPYLTYLGTCWVHSGASAMSCCCSIRMEMESPRSKEVISIQRTECKFGLIWSELHPMQIGSLLSPIPTPVTLADALGAKPNLLFHPMPGHAMNHGISLVTGCYQKYSRGGCEIPMISYT